MVARVLESLQTRGSSHLCQRCPGPAADYEQGPTKEFERNASSILASISQNLAHFPAIWRLVGEMAAAELHVLGRLRWQGTGFTQSNPVSHS